MISALLAIIIVSLVSIIIIVGISLLIGKLQKKKLSSLTIFCVDISKIEGKLSFKVHKPQELVRCTMTEGKDSFISMLIFELVPMGINLLLLAIIAVKLLLAKSFGENTLAIAIVMLLFAIFSAVNMYTAYKRLTKSSPFAQTKEFNLAMISKINEGIRPAELEMKDIEPYSHDSMDISYLTYLYIKFCHHLDKKDYTALKPFINAFANNLPKNLDELYIPQTYALLFYYSVIEKNPILANNYYDYVEAQLIKDNDVNGRRVYAYYMFYIRQDIELAYEAATEGLEVWDKFPDKGISLMEKDMLDELITVINNVRENQLSTNENI